MVTVLPTSTRCASSVARPEVAGTPLSDFGPAGATGGVWECPDLFELPVEGEPARTRWVLDVDINPGGIAGGSGGQYFVGTFDGTRFVSDHPPDQTLWADYGKDFYASLSFSDMPAGRRRRIWMAWISNWQYANEEPTDDVARRPVGAARRSRSAALPEGCDSCRQPVAELAHCGRRRSRRASAPATTQLPPSAEITSRSKRGRLARDRAPSVEQRRRGGDRRRHVARRCEVFVDRRKSRLTPFHRGVCGPPRRPRPRGATARITLRILFDRSVVEVFANDGETVVTDRVFPTQPLDRLELLPQAGPRPAAKMWTLGSGSTSRR